MLIAKIVVLLSIYLTQQKKNKKAKKAKKIDEEFVANYGNDFWNMVKYRRAHYVAHLNSKKKRSYYADVPINKNATSYTKINWNNPPLYSDFS